MSQHTTVLIADDHEFSSSGLQRLLSAQSGFEVLEPVRSGAEAIAMARLMQPDLAVLDYAMPGMTGLDAMREIRRWSPQTRVCVLTGTGSEGIFAALIAAGVDGLFLKSSDPGEILTGIAAVARGERVIARSATAAPVRTALSQRELQILGCIAEGLTNGGAAQRLSISVKTVESHRASLMRKLGVRSTARLLVRAMQEGLIDP